ncbi:MAG: glycosyltransferase family 4 protein [SAR324 cluster bacterium]|nr:glycosyltransferase family 4 protein [SAR324 cluster bacterium]
MKQIILVCQVFHPDTTSTSQLFVSLLRNMAKKGLSIHVLCGFPAGNLSDKTTPRYETLDGIIIKRCGFNIPLKQSLYHRALSYLSFLLHAGWEIIKAPRDSIFFGVTNPPFAAILLYLTSKVRKFSYHYMLLDLYPEGLVFLGNLEESSFITKIWYALNRLSYSNAAKLAVLGRDMIPLLQTKYHIPQKQLTYIPHWGATEIPVPISFKKSKLTTALSLQNKFVVQYSGNMGLWHDMETFVQAAVKLKNQPDIAFLFIGNGIRRSSAEDLALNLDAHNIIWKDFVPQEELLDSLSCSHVSLISLQANLAGVAVPCKLYGILASGRAIIAQVPADSEIAYVIEEEQCGVVVPPGDVDKLIEAIQQLAAAPDLVAKMGKNAFAAYQAKYTLRQAEQAFTQFLDLSI